MQAEGLVPQHGLSPGFSSNSCLHSPSLNAGTFLVSSEDVWGPVFRQEPGCIFFFNGLLAKSQGGVV